jgi:DNA-binding protein H-NS
MSELIINLPEGTVSGAVDREHLAKAIRLLEKKLHHIFMEDYQNLMRQADQLGISLPGVDGRAGKRVPRTTNGKTGPTVYVHPQDPTKTWSGRGRRPRWVVGLELEASRKSAVGSAPVAV